jgi:hypothetical protein
MTGQLLARTEISSSTRLASEMIRHIPSVSYNSDKRWPFSVEGQLDRQLPDPRGVEVEAVVRMDPAGRR